MSIDLYSFDHDSPFEPLKWNLRGYHKGNRLNQPYPKPGIRLFEMPGREWHITADESLIGPQLAVVQFHGSDDLVALAIWADAVRRDGGFPMVIFPYLPGARQDRRQPGEALSAVVYAKMINACNLHKVVCLDPHSDVMPSHINNLTIVPVTEICLAALALNPEEKIAGVIIPDAGAVKRAVKVAEALKVPYYQALKHRDMSTGKLSHFTCEDLPKEGRLLVVDDICDGGGTFVGLAGALFVNDVVAGHLPVGRERLALYVTHGIFSGAADQLGKHYSAIRYDESNHSLCMFA